MALGGDMINFLAGLGIGFVSGLVLMFALAIGCSFNNKLFSEITHKMEHHL